MTAQTHLPPSPTAADLISPITLLRLEGLATLVAASLAYQWAHTTLPFTYGWGVFALLFLTPDLAMLGYLRSARLGALLYNLVHTETVYAAVLAVGLYGHRGALVSLALIGIAHAGFDRLAGYGLKYATAFGDTHLGRVGKSA